jgi:hypothetical protein
VRDRGQPGESAVEQLPGGTPARVRDETDAAGVALEGEVVEERSGAQEVPPFGIGERWNVPPAGVFVASPAAAGREAG